MRDFPIHKPGLVAAALMALGTPLGALAQAPIPDNVGGGLRQLIEAQSNSALYSPHATLASRTFQDSQSRVMVNIWLDGSRPIADVQKSAVSMGASVAGVLATYHKGVISAYIAVSQATALAQMSGVRSVTLQHKPQLHVGKATSQGVATIRADKLNALGLKGQGVTVGLLSDSFNTAPNSVTHIHAAQDVRTGDLPGPGNPNGDTTPVVVIDEDPNPGTDEGRALVQIVYDIAPKAKLCYATAFTGLVQFASNILKLADTKGPCKANIIDDDVGYSEEPFFSDGAVALAIDQVKADGVAYFSSAGNNNSGNYLAPFNPISDGDARAKFAGNLNLGNVPTDLTGAGWHNFGTSSAVSLSIPIAAPPGDHFLVLQWDDPFFDIIPTASYDFLVFDANGLYHPELSGIDNIYSTGQPVQGISLPGGDIGANYFVAIALRPGGSTPHAMNLWMVDFDDGNQVTLQKFANRLAPSITGHPAAAGAIAVAADLWDNPASTEYYSSLGPVAIYFDGDNVRLPTPQIRKKPEIAAPDGVDTTFFGSPGFPDDPNPLFFGTSAAAPHAAGAAALLMQAAGGPNQITPDRIRSLFEATTQQPHQLVPGLVSANLTSGGDKLSITVAGFLPLDPNQFRFTFTGAAGDSVSNITFDATPSNIVFGDNTDQFLEGPGNVPKADIVYENNNGLSSVAKLDFLNGAFKNGSAFTLGLDIDNPNLGAFGINSGLLFGTKVTATIVSGGTSHTVTGTLSGPTGRAFAANDGFGLIDVFAAYQKLKGAN